MEVRSIGFAGVEKSSHNDRTKGLKKSNHNDRTKEAA